MHPTSCPRNWTEVDLAAVRHNLQVVREVVGPGIGIMAVVKADAYGHGLTAVARTCWDQGVRRFGVANVTEAAALQESLGALAAAGAVVSLLSPALPDERPEVVRRRLRPWLSDPAEAGAYAAEAARQAAADPGWAAGGALAVEVEIDTGMGRSGALEADAPALWAEVRRWPAALRLAGTLTHLPVPDEDEAFTRAELGRFEALLGRAGLPPAGAAPPVEVHAQNSAGLLGYPLAAGTSVVRPGLMLYGSAPLPAFQSRLRPALTFKTRVTLVRGLPAGHGVSYGRTFVTARPTRLATLAVGYADGYRRHLSNAGAEVLLRGRRCPVRGRVTMDQILVDVTALEAATGAAVAPGEEVVLLGRQGDQEIPAAELAGRAGTIPWDLFTGLTPRGGRRHVNQGDWP